MYGSHYIKGWSYTRATIALSSAEVELYAVVKASAELLGMLSAYRDFGVTLQGSMLGDASAALGIIRCKGIGKTRHIVTSFLWVQKKMRRRKLTTEKLLVKINPADLHTKYLSGDDIYKHAAFMHIDFVLG